MEESLLPARRVVARSAMNITTTPTTNILPQFANDTHPATEESLLPPRPVAAQSTLMSVSVLQDKSLLPHRHDAAHLAINKTTTPIKDGPPRFANDHYVGKDVTLFAMLRSDLPVARGTVISTNPNTMVGGEPLGKEFCEVDVNVVMKKDALLFRTYGGMQTMASALKMTIAWPYNKVKECKKKERKEASRPLKGSAGSAGHKSWA